MLATSSDTSIPLELTVRCGLAHLHVGHESIGETMLQSLINGNLENYSDLYYEVGETYLTLLNYEKALEFFNICATLEIYNTPSVWIRQAHCLRSLAKNNEELVQAQLLYEKILQHEPSNTDVRIGLSEIYRLLGANRKAYEMVNTSTINESNVIYNKNELRIHVSKFELLVQQHSYSEILNIFYPLLRNTLSAASGVLVESLKEQTLSKKYKTRYHQCVKVILTIDFMNILLQIIKLLTMFKRYQDAYEIIKQLESG